LHFIATCHIFFVSSEKWAAVCASYARATIVAANWQASFTIVTWSISLEEMLAAVRIGDSLLVFLDALVAETCEDK